MADSTPLLSHCDSTQTDEPKTLDDVIEHYIGGSFWPQFFQAFLVSIAWVFEAQQTFLTIFTDHQPKWHCAGNLTGTACGPASNICQLPADAWAWDRPAYTSTVSEWSLQCTAPFVAELPSSALFTGSLLGGFLLVTLADSAGRKNLLSYSCFAMSTAAFLTAFSVNMWVYSFLRFVSGLGRPIIGSCVVVLSTELVGKRWRGQVGIAGFLFSTVGILSLPAIAYLTRDYSWRILYLCTSIPSLMYCVIVHFFVCESPRWLLLQGREEEAISVFKKFAPPGSETLTLSLSVVGTNPNQNDPKTDFLSSIKLLFEKKWARRRLVAVMVVVFGTGITYYGIPLSVGNLSVNLYLSTLLNGLMEIPGILIALFLIRRWTRKSIILFFNTLSGVCSVLCAFVSTPSFSLGLISKLELPLEVMSLLSTCIVLSVLVVYVLELFPTRVRNSTTSMCRQAQVLSGVVCPLLIGAGKYNPFFSYGAFGFLSIVSGLFVVFLPRKECSVFCDTMDEQEQLDKEETVAAAVYVA